MTSNNVYSAPRIDTIIVNLEYLICTSVDGDIDGLGGNTYGDDIWQ